MAWLSRGWLQRAMQQLDNLPCWCWASSVDSNPDMALHAINVSARVACSSRPKGNANPALPTTSSSTSSTKRTAKHQPLFASRQH